MADVMSTPLDLAASWEQLATYHRQRAREYEGAHGVPELAEWYQGRAETYDDCARTLRTALAHISPCDSAQHDDGKCTLGADCPCYIAGCEEQRDPP